MSATPDPDRHRFPDGFLVGASTAAHQIEGNNTNSSWWAHEHRNSTAVREPSGDAADSLHRWHEDLDIVADAGLNAYRFSIEWARIEPAPGSYSRAYLDHYRRIVEGCRDRGVEPVVTLHHFTDPLWFARAGGWAGGDAVERFTNYVRACAPVLEGVEWVCTINEPNMAAIMTRAVGLMAGRDDPESAALDVPGAPLPAPHKGAVAAFVDAHRAAQEVLADIAPQAASGWTVASQVIRSIPGGEAAADAFYRAVEGPFLEAAAGDDFLGVQSYTRNVFGPDGPVRDDPADTRTQMGWEYWPEAVGAALADAAAVVGDTPLLVTENGIATDDDTRRIAYTDGALDAVRTAIDDGLDVRGYLHWSLLDNYEWGSYEPTFGLVAWDPETFERHPKPSAAWLGAVAGGVAPAG